ncbi:NADPH:adrenodoxin oxidoreductase, mitochondrial [Jatropha curcas]|uniref:NADPH:adrenodoxin oxidoreductase, mitochondrial n=1 Tax=Jatropha curcas TaxID=180498 RepID=UPI0005FACF9B|nr:NADPH:adrenodoxin oxidoreductase, mitochondrial [Jatropha curcas]
MFLAKTWLSRSFSTLSSHPLRVCVVGSGPAGFYTAEKMLKAHGEAEIDIIDRLPTPFGLVRSGVAPDHPETKIVINQFSRVVQHERCSFFGNVTLSSSISLAELRELYHVVILAYGAESDRNLGIPGEDLLGIHSAREFVWWYNGHPDCKNLNPDLERTDTAVILGQGNVALDVARILLRPTAELATTDIASHALAALEQSSIRKVYLVGRRGPVQAACTAKELREVLGIKDLYIHIKEVDLLKSSEDEEELKSSRIQRRVYELLSKAAASGPSHPSSGQRELHFVFFQKPDRFLYSGDQTGHVAGVHFEKTVLKGVGPGKQVAVGTGKFEDLDCGMVLKSIGYKSVPVDGLPFDHQKGVVPNVGGRVLTDASGDTTLLENGLYVCGWLKRGPTGIIATNLYCAEETVANILQDLEQGTLAGATSLSMPGREGLLELLDDRNVRVVPFDAWEKIDAEEKRLGVPRNKPREKLTTWEDLLKVATE